MNVIAVKFLSSHLPASVSALFRIICAFVVLNLSSFSLADSQRYVYLQNCTLEKSPETSLSLDWPMICIRFRNALESYFDTHSAKNNFWTAWSESSVKLYLFNFLGFHHKASIFSLYKFGEDRPTVFDRDVDEAIFTLGNPVIHKFRITGGLGSVPFGIDQDLRPESLERLNPKTFFYSDRIYGSLVFDDFYTLKVNASIFEDRDYFESRHKEGEGHKLRSQFVVRLVHRMSVLESTSIVASLGGAETNERRASLALLNVASESGATSMELVRKSSKVRLYDSGDDRVSQLFRLSYKSPFRRGHRVGFMFEENRGVSRLGLVKVDIALKSDQVLFSPTVQLERDLIRDSGYLIGFVFSLQAGV